MQAAFSQPSLSRGSVESSSLSTATTSATPNSPLWHACSSPPSPTSVPLPTSPSTATTSALPSSSLWHASSSPPSPSSAPLPSSPSTATTFALPSSPPWHAFSSPSSPSSASLSSSSYTNITSATAGNPPSRTSPPPPSPCSAPFPPPPFEVGDLVTRRYRITGLLGRGTTCITYAAEHTASVWPRPGRALALKAFPLTAFTSRKTLNLFHRDAATLRTLAHPAIPAYIDFFEVSDARGDRVFILVQHRATGDSLQHLIDHRARFSTSDVIAVFRQLLEILVYLGDLNQPLLHRDIRPANVILHMARDPHLLLSLVDFRAVNASIATAGTAEGQGEDQGVPTPIAVEGKFGFTPPEQFGGAVDARSDLYAVAATVLYMLTGRPLCTLPQTRLKIDMEIAISHKHYFELRNENAYSLMCKLLEPAPEDRYECAAEALDALLGKKNTRRAGEGAEGSGGGGSGGDEEGKLSRRGTPAFPGAEATIADRAVQRLQIVAKKSRGEHGGERVRNRFELLVDRAGGGRVPKRRKLAKSDVRL